jgi:SAM-dependent methyltransferase
MNIFQRMRPAKTIADYLSGDDVHCDICGRSFITFLPFGRIKRANAQCPCCDSLERHRLQYMYLSRETTLFDNKEKKLLHVAPEQIFFNRFSGMSRIQYFPIDKFTEGYAYAKGTQDADLLNLPFHTNYFDYIICNHVLEHIEDDRAAMIELRRVLKPGGAAFLQVPLRKDMAVTYEDPSIIDPQERIKHFGQFDHVRYYGRDYTDRLIAAGFRVDVIDYISRLGENAAFKYGLMAGEDIYRCTK